MAKEINSSPKKIKTKNLLELSGERQLQIMFEQAPIGVAVTDKKTGHFYQINPYFAKILGYSIEEMLEKTWMEITHPDDVEPNISNADYADAHNAGEFKMEKRYVKSNGDLVWVSLSIVPLELPEGYPLCNLSLVKDITYERKAFKELKKSNEKFSKTFHTFPDGVVITRVSDGMYIEVNEGLPKIIGYSAKEIIGKTVKELNVWVNPDDRKSMIEEIIAYGKCRDFETQFRRKDGKIIIADVSGTFIEINGEECLLSVIRDISAKKIIEMELSESRQQLQRSIREAPFPVMIYAEDGTITNINRAWEEITGYSMDKLRVYGDWTELAFGMRTEVDKSFVNRLYQLQNRQSDGTHTIQDANGVHHVWDFYSSPLGEMGDGRRLIMSMAVDVTEQRWQEQVLQEKEIKYRTLFEDAPDGIVIFNNDGKIIDVNRKMIEMEGYSLSELKNMSIFDLTAHNSKPMIQSWIKTVLAGKPWTKELQHYRKDGSIYPVSATASRILYEHNPSILVFYRDISEQKLFEEAHFDIERQYQLLFQNMTEGFALCETVLDKKGKVENYRFLAVNPALEKMTLLSKEKLIGKTLLEAFPKMPVKQLKYFLQLPHGEILVDYSKYNENMKKFFRIHFFPAGKNRIAVVLTDVTDTEEKRRKVLQLNAELEEKVSQRTKELADAYRMKSSFITDVGHELRTPLTSILGFSELISRGVAGPINEQQLVQINNVRKSGEYLLALINNVLDLAKIENGQQIPSFEEFSIIDMLSSLEAVVHPLLQEKSLHYEVILDNDIKTIYSDRIQLQQILLNLVGNAIKFTDDRGHISVDVHREKSNWLAIAVTDNGKGIAPEHLEKIFDEFYQVESDRSKKIGTGLGLAISKKLTEGLGGVLTVSSQEGKGSTFLVRLPLLHQGDNKPEPHRRKNDSDAPSDLPDIGIHPHRRSDD